LGYDSGGLLHLLSGLPRRFDSEFAVWCDRHHREVLAIPGVRRARRLVRCGDGEGPDRYFTCYDLDAPEVVDTVAFRSHGDHGTPMPDEITRVLSFERLVLRVADVAGTLGCSDHIARVAWTAGPTAEDAVRRWWPALHDQGLVKGMTIATAPPAVTVALFECDGDAVERLEEFNLAPGVPRPAGYRLVFEALSDANR
jgi:hypothetical protein